MYISIVKIDKNQKEEIMFSVQISEQDGVYKFSESDGAGFVWGNIKYCLSGEFVADSMKGYVLLKKGDVSLFRALTTLDPSFLLTLNIDGSNFLEINLSLDS